MLSETISFRNTGYFSSLICDYLDEHPELKQFYKRFPKLENFKAQIVEKQASFSTSSRTALVSVLKEQYQNIDASQATLKNIQTLQQDITFTITTGHQLNIFTGPLYFLYKIVSTINLCKELKVAYPNNNFVPVYWMANEDHDFEEINHFNFKGKKVQWNRESSGAVGDLSTDGLTEVFDQFSQHLGVGVYADSLRNLFTEAYIKHDNLTDATRFLANAIFKDYGLVIVDANNAELKQQLVPYIKNEFLNETSFKFVSETNERINKLANNYKIQVNPRQINVFYLKQGLRERIVFEDGMYGVVNTGITWTKDKIMAELENHPERFSPNVITRPLYQEVILPNLCYIGGGGELAYWFQLKEFFNQVKVPFPILLLRNSVLIETKQQHKKLKGLNISNEDIFLKRDTFINKKVREISNIDIDFSSQKEFLKQQFKTLYDVAEQTDKSFLRAVKAQEAKQLKGLEKLEKRLLKAQKRKLSDQVSRMTDIQNELFPNQSLQERNTNFSEFYLQYGDRLIPELIANLQPLKNEFLILTF
tara:strand:- start:10470 stop:12071 length:1602 start_codon:yes stop_codon:yes gene_type:complete